jgi:hypothetical protein
MHTKQALAPTWVQIDTDTPEKEAAYRARVGSEAGFLPRRKELLTNQHAARFLALMAASETHLDAIENAKRVLSLPAHLEPGERHRLFKLWCRNRTLEEALCAIFGHTSLFDGRPALHAGGPQVVIKSLDIATNRPHAELRLLGLDQDGNLAPETIRFGEGRIGFGVPMAPNLRIRRLSEQLIYAIARLTFSSAPQRAESNGAGGTSGGEPDSSAPENESAGSLPGEPAPDRNNNPPREPRATGHYQHPETKRVCADYQACIGSQGTSRKETLPHEVRC